MGLLNRVQNYIITVNRTSHNPIIFYFCVAFVDMRAIFLILWGLGAFASASAQYIDSIFVNMPRHLMPLLEKNDRLNLLDFYDASAQSNVRNKLNGLSNIVYKDSCQIDLQLTENTLIQLRTIPQKQELVIIKRHSVHYQYGEVAVYNVTDWLPSENNFPLLSFSDFLKTDLSLENKNLQLAYQHLEQEATIYYYIKPHENNLYAKLSFNTLNQKEQELIRPHIREEILLSLSDF